MSQVWKLEDISAGGKGHSVGEIRGVNLSVSAGEKVALVGHETGGRALLLRVMTGLRPHTAGELSVLEHKIARLPAYADWDELFSIRLRRKMGVALAREGLLSNVSLREGLELLFRFKYGDSREKLREGARKIVRLLCEKFDLVKIMELRPSHLSSADKRLAALARAFLSKPPVVVLEDPSEGVGNLSRGRLWSAVQNIVSSADRSVVISTDDLELALAFCPRWVVLDEGEVVFDGRPEDFLRTSHPVAQSYSQMSRSASNS